MKELMYNEIPEAEVTEKEDLYRRAKEDVISLLALIENIDLNKSLGVRIEEYFDSLDKETNSADKFRIPDFSENLWEIYGDFLDQNKEDAKTSEFQEIDSKIRTEFMPRFVDTLTSYSIQISSQKSE